MKLMKAGFVPGEVHRLLTLTFETAEGHEATREDMIASNEQVRALIRELRDRGYVVHYFKVPEFTKAGRIHFHLIIRGSYIPKCTDAGRREHGLPTGPRSDSPCYCTKERPCLQQLAWWQGFGWVEIRMVHSPKAAALYVSKYLGKTMGDVQFPKWAQRYSNSAEWAPGVTRANIHQEWVEKCRAKYGHLWRKPLELPAVSVGWELIPPPHNREHVIWAHGPPRRPLAFHYPHHLAGRLWNPDTGEVFALPKPAPKPEWSH